MAKPRKIQRLNARFLSIEWEDQQRCILELKTLRTFCPCAVCRGENVMGTVYRIPEMQTYTPGMYELVKIELVGNYAIRLYWQDGHDSGIYDWEMLRQLCQTYGRSGDGAADATAALDAGEEQ